MTATKLTKAQQQEIRKKYRKRQQALRDTRDYTIRNLAKAYDVGYMVIWRLVELDSWAFRDGVER